MIRTLLVYWLLRLVHRLMPDIGQPMTAPVLPPLPAFEHLPDRYVRELVSLEHAKLDVALGYIFGTQLIYGAKVADTRWRQ